MKFFKQFKTNTIAGILIIIPAATTLYLVVTLFTWIDSMIPEIIKRFVPDFEADWAVGLGFIIVISSAYFIGLSAKNYIGKMIIDTGNSILASIPLLNKVYMGIQQIIDSVGGKQKNIFEEAVLIEYPKENSYCIGFVTANTTGEIPEILDKEMVSIFVPTTPNPTSGFLLFLPRADVMPLNMSVETAIKTVMSAGVMNTDQIKETNHLYKIQKKLSIGNWFKNKKRKKKQGKIPQDEISTVIENTTEIPNKSDQ